MKDSARETAEGMLFTDQYQLTMAQLYFRLGLHETPVMFDHFFRNHPDYNGHRAGYCINAGLAWFLEWMQTAAFRSRDLDYLRGQKDRAGGNLFHDDFLRWLGDSGNFSAITLRGIAEGRVVHPNVPLNTIQGPLAMSQIVETALLNHLNYATLIATKAARIHQAGRGRTMMEFGMRRAQGKAANAGARAALIGGADFTSNVGVSHLLGYPPQGTHAHSMVQLFMTLGHDELAAFRAYADIYPDDCLLLVDTIDTLGSGVPNAIKVFEELRKQGHRPVGIRLDSGDLAYLTVESARMLDKAGFEDTLIVLSNQLDEITIWQILTQIEQDAHAAGLDIDALVERMVYGVGTRLITSHGNAALDGVFKLVAVRSDGNWKPAIKVSENPVKTPNPGSKRVWRLYDRRGMATADLITLDDEDPQRQPELILRHPIEHNTYRTVSQSDIIRIEELQTTQLDSGRWLQPERAIETMRQRRREDLARLDPGVKRLVNPHIYHVSLSEKLWQLKQDLVRQAR